MSKNKLDSFKIGDKQRPQVKSTSNPAGNKPRPTQATALPESQTFGFSRIEAILDKESAEEVSKQLHAHLEALNAYEQQAQGLREKSNAQKAKHAIEHTQQLLDYLFRTKAAMQTPRPSDALANAAAGKEKPGHKGHAKNKQTSK